MPCDNKTATGSLLLQLLDDRTSLVLLNETDSGVEKQQTANDTEINPILKTGSHCVSWLAIHSIGRNVWGSQRGRNSANARYRNAAEQPRADSCKNAEVGIEHTNSSGLVKQLLAWMRLRLELEVVIGEMFRFECCAFRDAGGGK